MDGVKHTFKSKNIWINHKNNIKQIPVFTSNNKKKYFVDTDFFDNEYGKYVKINDSSTIKYVSMRVKKLINELQREKGKNIWICGGANLISQCVAENLIDEYQITTVPVILGSGIRLFYDNNKKIMLELESTKEGNGLITAIYRKK